MSGSWTGAGDDFLVDLGNDLVELDDIDLADGDVSDEGEIEDTVQLRGADIDGWLDDSRRRFAVTGINDRTFVRVMSVEALDATLAQLRAEERNATEHEAWGVSVNCGGFSEVLNLDKQLRIIDGGILDRVEALKEDFPNFSEAIDWAVESLSLALMGPAPYAWMPPLLLNGPPGVGKTAFMSRLAKAIGVHYGKIDCSQVAGNFELFGHNAAWKNASMGRVTREMRDSRDANPMIMLDEIDKSRGDERFPVQAALNQVFERETASRFRDGFLDIPIDLSRIMWVCTSNDLSSIESYVLSRAKVVEVEKPTPEQMHVISQSVWRALREEHIDTWGQMFSPRLTSAVVDRLVSSGLTPRIMKRVLTQACARVARRAATQQSPDSVRYGISVGDIRIEGSDLVSEKRSIGFSC